VARLSLSFKPERKATSATAATKPPMGQDLRHLFATRCIESGVDIPTVSRWLGHQDGGALCMKTYGHLRDEHSTNEARKVTF
jgi:integrase